MPGRASHCIGDAGGQQEQANTNAGEREARLAREPGRRLDQLIEDSAARDLSRGCAISIRDIRSQLAPSVRTTARIVRTRIRKSALREHERT